MDSATVASPLLKLEQDGAGDTSVHFLLTGGTEWSIGIDNSDSDSFKIGYGDNLANSNVVTLTTGGDVGVDVSSPQGKLHGYDTIGGFMYWEGDGVDDTPVTIIPNGAGDVQYLLRVISVVRGSGGDTSGETNNIEPGSGAVLAVITAGNLTLSVAADGSVTIVRTAGAGTFKVALWMTWI